MLDIVLWLWSECELELRKASGGQRHKEPVIGSASLADFYPSVSGFIIINAIDL